jgi:hypothetical protein
MPGVWSVLVLDAAARHVTLTAIPRDLARLDGSPVVPAARRRPASTDKKVHKKVQHGMALS